MPTAPRRGDRFHGRVKHQPGRRRQGSTGPRQRLHWRRDVEAKERTRLISRYRDGYGVVVEALDGVTEEELDRSATGEWTPRQIAHHLADSEMMSAIRLRRLITEETPVIHGYDEADFAKKLTYDRPIAPSLEAMRYARESSAQILDRLSEA